MTILFIFFIPVCVLLGLLLFSLSSGAAALWTLRRKKQLSGKAAKDFFITHAQTVFGNSIIQRGVCRCILWGMSIIVRCLKK